MDTLADECSTWWAQVKQHGVGKWAAIIQSEAVLHGRSGDSVRGRYNTLVGRNQKQESEAPVTSRNGAEPSGVRGPAAEVVAAGKVAGDGDAE